MSLHWSKGYFYTRLLISFYWCAFQVLVNKATMISSVYCTIYLKYCYVDQVAVVTPASLQTLCSTSDHETLYICTIFLWYRKNWSLRQDIASICNGIPDINYTAILTTVYSILDQSCRTQCFLYRSEVGVTSRSCMDQNRQTSLCQL